MSASQKKQLRKEQNAAKMTEKQLQEAKESKKLRLYTIAFTVAIVLMLCVVIVTSVTSSGILQRNTTAATVDDTSISAVEFNYFYVDTVNNFLNYYSDYLSWFGIDSSVPLDEQVYDEEAGTTWADYFIDGAASNAKSTYAIYNLAVANGYELPEEASTAIDSTLSTMGIYAAYYGYSSVSDYIKAVYGAGSSEESYRAYCEAQYLASYYAEDYYNSLEYTSDDLRAAEEENYDAFSTYSYNYYYIAASKYLEGGTTDDEGNTTYSDEETAASIIKCEAAAQLLASAEYASVEEFNAAINSMPINSETTASSTACADYDYDSVNTLFIDWLNEEGRQAGDTTVIPNEYTTHNHEDDEECTGEGDETTIKGYYVVYFGEKNDNNYPLANVRHILISYEGGTTDSNGNVTYSDEEKAAAKAKAEELLNTFLAGEATEEAFAELAKENSTDTGSKSNGGLYEDVYPGQMVTNFNDWCFDESRQAGDTGIVQSDEYGYHIMYYVGDSETIYRDYLIENELREADSSAWEAEIVEAATITVKNTKYVDTDITLG